MVELASLRNVLAYVFFVCLVTSEAKAEIYVTVDGMVVEGACSIRPGDENIALGLGSVAAEYLYLNGRTAGREFSVHLEGCKIIRGDKVTITFSGTPNLELPGLLALSPGSAASGFGIGVETPAGVLLPLGEPSEVQALVDGDNELTFRAFLQGEPRAIADREIEPGIFIATSTFVLAYP